MARRKAEELLTSLAALIGENDSEEYTTLMEDITDSVVEDKENWKEKYEENDRNWRQRYRDRFLGKEDSVHEWRQQDMRQHSEAAVMQNDTVEETTDITNFDDLFKTED